MSESETLASFAQKSLAGGLSHLDFARQATNQFVALTAPALAVQLKVVYVLNPYDFAQSFKVAGFTPVDTAPQLAIQFPTITATDMAQTLVNAWADAPPPKEQLTGLQVEAALEAVNVATPGFYTDAQINEGLLAVGFWAGVYIRDTVQDTGTVPSTGALWMSPDIIPRQDLESSPQTAFGQAQWNNNNIGQNIESGQDNYVYIRAFNRGTLADNPTAHIFWSAPSSFIRPSDWNSLGTLQFPLIAPGAYFVTDTPAVWARNTIPPQGHYCFVCYLESPRNPLAIPTAFGSDGEYQAFMADHNTAVWRNANVVNARPDMPSGFTVGELKSIATFEFHMRGFPEREALHGLRLQGDLPASTGIMVDYGNGRQAVRYTPNTWSPIVNDLSLHADEDRIIAVSLTFPAKEQGKQFMVSICQFTAKADLGCVNYIVNV